jgi:hypothetical protein
MLVCEEVITIFSASAPKSPSLYTPSKRSNNPKKWFKLQRMHKEVVLAFFGKLAQKSKECILFSPKKWFGKYCQYF